MHFDDVLRNEAKLLSRFNGPFALDRYENRALSHRAHAIGMLNDIGNYLAGRYAPMARFSERSQI